MEEEHLGAYLGAWDRAECTSLVLEAGYDVNREMSTACQKLYRDQRSTALFFAIFNDDEDITNLLLDHGADPNIDKINPIYMAILRGNTDLVHLLLENGARLDMMLGPSDSLFPAALAFASTNVKMMGLILKWNIDPSGCFTCACTEKATDHQYKLLLVPDYSALVLESGFVLRQSRWLCQHSLCTMTSQRNNQWMVSPRGFVNTLQSGLSLFRI